MTSILTGRTAFITGASGGIGHAIARSLAEAGADLILHAHSGRERLETLTAELAVAQPHLHIRNVFADLTCESGRADLIAETTTLCHAPDILVLAAGLDLMSEAAKRLSFEARLEQLWQLDVTATIQLARCFGRRMQQMRRNDPTANTGAIVLFGWDGVEYGMAGETAQLYAAAKGAVQGFARSFARSVAPEVRVNCVAPGWIKTTWGETASAKTDDRVAAESLARRWGTPDEVAALVRFLVSDAAAYVNGQTICVNGGKT